MYAGCVVRWVTVQVHLGLVGGVGTDWVEQRGGSVTGSPSYVSEWIGEEDRSRSWPGYQPPRGGIVGKGGGYVFFGGVGSSRHPVILQWVGARAATSEHSLETKLALQCAGVNLQGIVYCQTLFSSLS